MTRSRLAAVCERVEQACKDPKARENLSGFAKDEVLAVLNHLLSKDCANLVDDDSPYRNGYKAVLKKMLDAVPDLAWIRELRLDKKVAMAGIEVLAEDNLHSMLAGPAQICLWLLTGFNQSTILRYADVTNLKTHKV